MHEPSPLCLTFALFVGIWMGSFLNLLALRTLREERLFAASRCSNCRHKLGALEQIPIVSYLLLRGHCRYCQAKISWQYPAVEFATGIAFVVILYHFNLTLYALGMIVFVSTLIAVCITDFREKLIPHEITYPSMLAGIAFSTIVRNDLIYTLAGIGISYILFDFLAFYGLKVYKHCRHPDAAESADNQATSGSTSALVAQSDTTAPSDIDAQIDENFGVSEQENADEIEVMGGADAVLAAVIAAWLGLSKLGIALIVGFFVGALLGAGYLAYTMYRHGIISKVIKPAVLASFGLIFMIELFLWLLSRMTTQPFLSMPWFAFALFAIFSGILLGLISAGSHLSKPFPFGPALAAGALFAMFCN